MEKKQVSFFRRFAAYLIDVMLLTIITSIISTGFTSTTYEKTLEKYEDLTLKYSTQEITIEEYNEQVGPLYYDLQKSSVAVSIITVALSIAYFIVFQYLNKGQTIGKKILGLRVQENGKDPSLKSIIIRTVIVDSILSGTLAIILLYALNKNNYYSVYNIVSTVEMIFVFITALFILYRKDKKGLHDVIAHTEVINERGN